jgi:hypothetical protein
MELMAAWLSAVNGSPVGRAAKAAMTTNVATVAVANPKLQLQRANRDIYVLRERLGFRIGIHIGDVVEEAENALEVARMRGSTISRNPAFGTFL